MTQEQQMDFVQHCLLLMWKSLRYDHKKKESVEAADKIKFFVSAALCIPVTPRLDQRLYVCLKVNKKTNYIGLIDK